MLATNHLSGDGCPLCSQRPRYTTETWKATAIEKYGDRYDYSKVDYKNSRTKVCIICHEKDEFGREHGEFWQEPVVHLKGCSHPDKANDRNHLLQTSNTKDFLEKLLKRFPYSFSILFKNSFSSLQWGQPSPQKRRRAAPGLRLAISNNDILPQTRWVCQGRQTKKKKTPAFTGVFGGVPRGTRTLDLQIHNLAR